MYLYKKKHYYPCVYIEEKKERVTRGEKRMRKRHGVRNR